VWARHFNSVHTAGLRRAARKEEAFMKLHFEPNLDYQRAGIEAVCDLFRGQEICRTEFTVTRSAVGGAFLPGMENNLGIGNRLTLLDDHLIENLNNIQLRNGLRPSTDLASGDFTVEMETGTGKTYVYQRTIFELNKRYGFTKFVIVVPSVAIKEGVYASIQGSKDHFTSLYAGVPFDPFIYDSSKLGQVRNFATSPNIQIMIVTVGAINRGNWRQFIFCAVICSDTASSNAKKRRTASFCPSIDLFGRKWCRFMNCSENRAFRWSLVHYRQPYFHDFWVPRGRMRG
jgi:restriction endonuclease